MEEGGIETAFDIPTQQHFHLPRLQEIVIFNENRVSIGVQLKPEEKAKCVQ